MNKKKAKMYTILLIIVVFGLLFLSCFLKFEDYVDSLSLFNIIASSIAGSWIGEKIYMFYKWLLEKEEK